MLRTNDQNTAVSAGSEEIELPDGFKNPIIRCFANMYKERVDKEQVDKERVDKESCEVTSLLNLKCYKRTQEANSSCAGAKAAYCFTVTCKDQKILEVIARRLAEEDFKIYSNDVTLAESCFNQPKSVYQPGPGKKFQIAFTDPSDFTIVVNFVKVLLIQQERQTESAIFEKNWWDHARTFASSSRSSSVENLFTAALGGQSSDNQTWSSGVSSTHFQGQRHPEQSGVSPDTEVSLEDDERARLVKNGQTAGYGSAGVVEDNPQENNSGCCCIL